jgi:hypothetical protein
MSSKKTKTLKQPTVYVSVFYGGIIKSGHSVIKISHDDSDDTFEEFKEYYGDNLKFRGVKCTKSIEYVEKEIIEKLDDDKKISNLIYQYNSTDIIKIIKEICEVSKCITKGVFASKKDSDDSKTKTNELKKNKNNNEDDEDEKNKSDSDSDEDNEEDEEDIKKLSKSKSTDIIKKTKETDKKTKSKVKSEPETEDITKEKTTKTKNVKEVKDVKETKVKKTSTEKQKLSNSKNIVCDNSDSDVKIILKNNNKKQITISSDDDDDDDDDCEDN